MSHNQMLQRHHPDYKAQFTLVLQPPEIKRRSLGRVRHQFRDLYRDLRSQPPRFEVRRCFSREVSTWKSR